MCHYRYRLCPLPSFWFACVISVHALLLQTTSSFFKLFIHFNLLFLLLLDKFYVFVVMNRWSLCRFKMLNNYFEVSTRLGVGVPWFMLFPIYNQNLLPLSHELTMLWNSLDSTLIVTFFICLDSLLIVIKTLFLWNWLWK